MRIASCELRNTHDSIRKTQDKLNLTKLVEK
jgi:hypothetical protein